MLYVSVASLNSMRWSIGSQCRSWHTITNTIIKCIINTCLALLWPFLMIENWMSPTRTPRHSICFGHVHTEHTPPLMHQSTAWYHPSSVFLVFLGVYSRRRCRAACAYINCPLLLHGQSIATSFSWPLPGSEVSAATRPVKYWVVGSMLQPADSHHPSIHVNLECF